jgi:hypothetical protein
MLFRIRIVTVFPDPSVVKLSVVFPEVAAVNIFKIFAAGIAVPLSVGNEVGTLGGKLLPVIVAIICDIISP